jgi:DNA polymerase-3 subunit gamma/tau
MASAQEQSSVPVRALRSFAELVAFASEKRDLMIKGALEADVRLIKFEDGRLEIALEPNAQRSLVSDLTRKLEMWTGRRWTVIVSNAAGQPTLREQNLAAKGQREAAAEADPRVKEVLARFPGAKVVEVRQLAPEPLESDISADPDAEEADNLGPGPDSDDP